MTVEFGDSKLVDFPRERFTYGGQDRMAIACFNIFFADNGAYKEYVSLRDTKKRSAGKEKDKLGYSYDLTIRVLRAQLKARLKADNVIE